MPEAADDDVMAIGGGDGDLPGFAAIAFVEDEAAKVEHALGEQCQAQQRNDKEENIAGKIIGQLFVAGKEQELDGLIEGDVNLRQTIDEMKVEGADEHHHHEADE